MQFHKLDIAIATIIEPNIIFRDSLISGSWAQSPHNPYTERKEPSLNAEALFNITKTTYSLPYF